MLERKTVLITGGSGFLGKYLTEIINYLNENYFQEPCYVIVMDNQIISNDFDFEWTEKANIKLLKHDAIREFKWKKKIDYIIHAAGIASPYFYRRFPIKTLEVATIGTKNMLDLARQSNARFIFFSSSEIYGDPDPIHVPTQESYRGNVSVAGPRACYDESKRLGETLCYIYHNEYGISTNIIRPFNIFGPGMSQDDYRVLPNFAARIKADIPLQIYSTGIQTRTFCYITDAIEGFMRVLLKGVPGEAYNIGNPVPEISILDLVDKIEKVVGRKLRKDLIEYPDSYPPDEPMRRCPDIRKASLQLKYKPKVDLNEGLKRFFNWTEQAYKG